MNKIEKSLQILVVAVIVLMVLIFFVSIMVGHSTDYRFLFSSQDLPKLTLATLSNGKVIL